MASEEHPSSFDRKGAPLPPVCHEMARILRGTAIAPTSVRRSVDDAPRPRRPEFHSPSLRRPLTVLFTGLHEIVEIYTTTICFRGSELALPPFCFLECRDLY